MDFKVGDYVEIDCGWYHLVGTIVSRWNLFCTIEVDMWKEKNSQEWSYLPFFPQKLNTWKRFHPQSTNHESKIIAIKKTRTRWQTIKA